MMDLSLTSLPLLVTGGLVVGFLVGITGVGAGSLTTPFLISAIGVPPQIAVGTDLLFAAITKSSAAVRHHRLGNVDWRILKWLAAGSLPAALLIAAWLATTSFDKAAVAALIRRALSVALVISAAAVALYPLVRARAGAKRVSPVTEAAASDVAVKPISTVVLGMVLGALVVLTSVGAGAIGVVVLTALYPPLLMRRLVGTDIVHAIPLTFAAGSAHFGLGNVHLPLLGLLLLGSIPGILLGSRLTGKVPDWLLRIVLAAVLLLAAYALHAKG